MSFTDISYYGKVKELLAGDYLKVFPILTIFVVASLLDLAGLSLIAAFIQAVLAPENSIIISFLNSFRFLSEYTSFDMLVISGLGLLFFYILKTLFGLFVNKTMVSFSQLRQRRLSNLLTEKLLGLNPLEARNEKSAYYIQNIQILTDSFSKQVLLPIFRICSDGLIVLMLLVYLATQNIIAFGLIFWMVIILSVAYDRFFGRIQQLQGEISNKASQNVVQNVGEIFLGITEIKLFAKKDFFMDKVKRQTRIFSEATAKGLMIALAPKYAIELVLMSYIIGIYILLSATENSQVEILATFGVYAFAAMRIIPLGNSLLNAVSELRLRTDTVNRLYSNIKSGTENFTDIQDGINDKNLRPATFKTLEFRDVKFDYDPDKPILNKINFKIKSGELVALIGESGSGKSTILALILGFIKPTFGEILLNSKSNYCDNYFENNCSYSPQTPFCMSGSIFENVALEYFDSESSKKAMACLVQSGFTDDYDDSILHEKLSSNGTNLSGGQMQRLALARAFFFDRDILLLDEMTSSLDPSMERMIFSTVKKMKGEKTIIVSTHSVDELDGFDRIFEVKGGQVVQLR